MSRMEDTYAPDARRRFSALFEPDKPECQHPRILHSRIYGADAMRYNCGACHEPLGKHQRLSDGGNVQWTSIPATPWSPNDY